MCYIKDVLGQKEGYTMEDLKIRLATNEVARMYNNDIYIGGIWDVRSELFINVEKVGSVLLLTVDGDSFHVYVSKLEICNTIFGEVLEVYEMKDFELIHKEFPIGE